MRKNVGRTASNTPPRVRTATGVVAPPEGLAVVCTRSWPVRRNSTGDEGMPAPTAVAAAGLVIVPGGAMTSRLSCSMNL